MTFIKRIFFTIFLLLFSGAIIFVGMKAPQWHQDSLVKEHKIAPKFNAKQYEGWAITYKTLERENNLLYSSAHKLSDDDLAKNKALYGIDKDDYLPDKIENFGIAVQKPYSSNYVFTQQKDSILQTYDNESSQLLAASNSFIPVNKNLNANDAEVIKAIEGYMLLIDKLNTATSKITLEESKNKALGEYINENVGNKVFSEPIVYGQLATNYLKANIDRYKSDFAEYADGAADDKRVPEVKAIAGIAD